MTRPPPLQLHGTDVKTWMSNLKEGLLKLRIWKTFLFYSTITLPCNVSSRPSELRVPNSLTVEIHVYEVPDVFFVVMGQLWWFDWKQKDLYEQRLWLTVSAQSLAHGCKSVQKNLSQNMLSSCFMPHLLVTAAGAYAFLLSKMCY